ncbi:MAG TPA: MFS transporter [Acetobacteraceae bacterium]
MTLGRRLGLVLGFTQTLAWATTFYMPTVVVGPASGGLHQSPTLLLGGFSWSLLIAGLASPRVGRRIDRHGGRGVLAGSSVVMAVGLVVMAALPNLAGWWIGWTVIGAGMALGLYDAAFATIGRLLGQQARPVIVGVTLMAGFASTVGWPMGVGLVHLLGWRGTLVVYAAIQLGLNLPLILWLVPRAGNGAATGPPVSPVGSSRQAGTAALILLAGFFSVRAGISAVVSVHALRLLQGVGLSAGAAVGVAALFGPSQVFGRVLEWSVARRFDPFATSVMGAVLLPAGAAALLAGAPPVVFAVGYGMSNGILTISRGTLPMHLFGARGYAIRLGRLALPALLAQAAAPTAITPLVLAWPASRVFAALGIAAVLALLCLLPLHVLASRRVGVAE